MSLHHPTTFNCIPHSLIFATSSKRTWHTNLILPLVMKNRSTQQEEWFLKEATGWTWQDSGFARGGFTLPWCFLVLNLTQWFSTMGHDTFAYSAPSHVLLSTGERVYLHKLEWNLRLLRTKVTLMCSNVHSPLYACGGGSWKCHVGSDFKRLRNLILDICIPFLWPHWASYHYSFGRCKWNL